MSYALINKIINFSSVDGIGNRTSIFLQGCNFNCKYCHNPETINVCNNCGECVSYCKSKSLSIVNKKVVYDIKKCIGCDACIKICKFNASPRIVLMTPREVFERIKKNFSYIRGITVSGGECTLYRDFILNLLKLIHNENKTIYLDSNGSYDFSLDDEFLENIDGVMLDVKAYDENEHKKLTSMTNEIVLKNLDYLSKNKKLIEVRTVVILDEFDYKNTVEFVSKKLKNNNSLNTRYRIIKFRENGVRNEYKNFKVPSDDVFLELKNIVESYGIEDVIIT